MSQQGRPSLAIRPARSGPRPRSLILAPKSGALRSAPALLWKAPCLRGAPYGLTARLPPELRLERKTGTPLTHPLFPRFRALLSQARAFMSDKPQTTAPDYSKTLYLPQTEFPMRAGLPQREPEILKRWNEIDLYGQ